jgi:cysteinyl-tRNA synthetase
MPEALAALFEGVHAGHRALDEGRVEPAAAAAARDLLDDLDRVLGLAAAGASGPGEDILRRVEARQAARTARDWAESDRIRDELAALGWEVRDSPEGPKLRKLA